MKSAFGVEHGPIAKAAEKKLKVRSDARLPRVAGNVVPAATVRAFDNSRSHKTEAAGINVGAKIAGSAAGMALGGAGGVLAAKKMPWLGKPSRIALKAVSASQKASAAKYVGVTGGGAVGSTIASEAASRHIRRTKRYRYEERGL